MYNNRRRLRNYDENRIYTNGISTLNNDDSLAVAYYLFELSKDADNDVIKNERSFFNCLYALANNLNLGNRMKQVFETYVTALVESGKLNIIEEEGDDNISSERQESAYQARQRRIRNMYTFEEDSYVNQIIDIDDISEIEKNFLRILIASQISIYSQLVYNLFFTKGKINTNKYYSEAPVRILKKARDFSKLDFIKNELNLSVQEAGYLLLRYKKVAVEYMDDIFRCLSKNSCELYTKLLGIKKKDFTNITRSDQKLRQFGFINAERELNPALIECIENQDFSLFFADCIKPVDLENSYEMKSFSVPAENSAIYRKLLESDDAVSMLLYGNPGSGKTEYAKALIKSSGKKALIFKNEAEVMDKKETLERLNCLLSLDRKDTVLIVDEADTLLETLQYSFFGRSSASESKGLINKMLELSQNKVIWIVNYKSQIDESTLRRFTISYQFNAMTPVMLESIAKKKLNSINLSDESKGQILKLLSCYKVTGASVDNVIKTINAMTGEMDESLLVKYVEIVLKDNSMLLNGKAKMREVTNSAYDSSVLNTNLSAEKILKMLNNAKAYSDKNPGSGAVRMLFYGLSGTGKTEFARHIGQILGKKLLLKRASDIFGSYVGETEENIARAFHEAAEKDMILLFDEADSFFADRNKAVRNFERTQVNEFLTQLEEFPGIVICTTNLRNIMDAAMLRRFHITVEFKALKKDGIKALLEKYFPSFKFDEKLVGRLLNQDTVTPGDFGRLADTIKFMDEEDISAEMIVDELCNIQREKAEGDSFNRKIGFCA